MFFFLFYLFLMEKALLSFCYTPSRCIGDTLSSVYKQPKKLRTSLCCLNFSQIWLVLLLIRCLNFLITFVTHFENIRISNFYLKLGIYWRVIWQIRKRQGFYHCISIQTVWISRVIAKQTFDFWKICCLVPKHWTSCVA